MENEINDLIEISMVLIPEGIEEIRRFKDNNKWLSSNYRMSIPSSGNNQQQTIKKSKINSFEISKYPVTNQIYNAILGLNNNEYENELKPRVNISWIESIIFCNKISSILGLTEYYTIDIESSEVKCNPSSKGFRLPTDAEWQYACKAGSKSYQYSVIDDIAWHKGNSEGQIHNVAEKKPNEWKLFDMLGNVWEWCWDLYNQETYASYRIFRGGSFAEEGRVCGATTRRKSHPEFAIDDIGFRLARSV